MSANDNDEFVADAFGIQEGIDPAWVRLQFVRDNEERAVIVGRAALPSILREIQSKIGSAQVTPIARGSMQIGARFAIQGWQVSARPQVGKTLTLFVDMVDEGRVVTVPMDLDPAQLSKLIADLSR